MEVEGPMVTAAEVGCPEGDEVEGAEEGAGFDVI